MSSNEIDACPGPTTTVFEEITRSRKAGCQFRYLALIAFPIASHRVAKAIVPFGPSRWKATYLISARSDIPGFSNQLRRGQHGILSAALQKSATFIEALRLPAKDGREVKTE